MANQELRELVKRAREIVKDAWLEEQRWNANFDGIASKVAMSWLSDAQHLTEMGLHDRANNLINMAKVILSDISGVNHSSQPHREDALARFREDYGQDYR